MSEADSICFACQRPGATVRGVDGEIYHGSCRREFGQEPATIGRRQVVRQ